MQGLCGARAGHAAAAGERRRGRPSCALPGPARPGAEPRRVHGERHLPDGAPGSAHEGSWWRAVISRGHLFQTVTRRPFWNLRRAPVVRVVRADTEDGLSVLSAKT